VLGESRVWVAVAVVVPLALSLAFGAALVRPIAPGTLPSPATESLDERLARSGEWAVVVLGNSTAQKGVRSNVLGQALGVPGRVVKATLPSSSPVTWYATLAHRVFATGHRPELVVVAAPSHNLWQERPEASLDLRELLEIAGTTDPVVQRHLGAQGRQGPLHTMDVRRQSVRAAAVGAVSRAALFAAGAQTREDTLDLFVVGARRRVLFGDAETGATAEGAALAGSMEQTILPELVALAREHGSDVVFAVTPSRAGVRGPGEDARDEALGVWAEEHGSALLRVGRRGPADEDFADNWHLTPAASVAWSEALGRAILTWRRRKAR
jgi:hypothetical protein